MSLAARSAPELVRFFEALLQNGFEGWDLLYLFTQAAALPVFQKACRDWLGDPDLTLGYRLFAGLGGIPETEAGFALWRLAALAHADREAEAVRHVTTLRQVLLKLGEWLEREGVLARAEDVFFLEVTELVQVAARQAQFDVRAVICQRRGEYEANLTLTPPPVVVGRFDPATQAVPTVDASATVLQGIPVFPGVVTGPARVILRADDHEQVLPGEILVAPFTDPAWTPYFFPAAGVVMDLGGILSHGSIVAREYGLPAVTNAGSATRFIRTGDLVQVDGSSGCVVILKRAATALA